MADIVKVTFAFPADAYAGMVDSFAAAYNWPETVIVDGEAVPNPETKEQHLHRKVVEFVEIIWKPYAKKIALAKTEQQVAAGIEQRAAEVRDATTITTEQVTE